MLGSGGVGRALGEYLQIGICKWFLVSILLIPAVNFGNIGDDKPDIGWYYRLILYCVAQNWYDIADISKLADI